MVQHPIALAGIYKVLAKFHNKFLNNVRVACFRFLPCTRPALRMLWSGQVAKDSAWQQPGNRKAAREPPVFTLLSHLPSQGAFMSVLPSVTNTSAVDHAVFILLMMKTKFKNGGLALVGLAQ